MAEKNTPPPAENLLRDLREIAAVVPAGRCR